MARGALFLKLTPWICFIPKTTTVRFGFLFNSFEFSLPPDTFPLMIALFSPAFTQDEEADLGSQAIRGLHQTERTLLCRWMVYSRATTSSRALRPAPDLPAVDLLDLPLGGIVKIRRRNEE